MARLGIDFGTTNTVVVCSDRGRYPVVPHVVDTAIGQIVRDVFPSLVAYEHATGRFLYGPDAERCLARPGAHEHYSVIRSIKRLLRDYGGGGRVGADIRPGGFDTAEVLRGFADAVRASMRRAGVLRDDEPLHAVLTWPANANGAQRYVTRTCFRDAGFEVIGTLNEPSAAAIEYADRAVHGHRTAARRLAATVAIFDFGGGTFDASLVRIDGTTFTVLDSTGIGELGGDDLDDTLARMFAEAMHADFDALPRLRRELLLRHACQQKESIASGVVRSLTLLPADVGLRGDACTVTVAAYFRRLQPVIAPAVDALAAMVNGPAARAAGVGPGQVAAVYLVGGSSKLPLVAELIAARLPGVRLVVSDKPFTATAMGAAIYSSECVNLHEILSRHFGVLRLADHGAREYFAPIFPAGTRLPARGAAPLQRRVEYSPRHNIGHLRYFECAGIDDRGRPGAGARAWSDVLFPYDPSIPVDDPLSATQVAARDDLAEEAVCETYACDSDGVITVHLTRRRDGQSRAFEIFRN
jgi:molecular chaperone DnaK